MWQDGASVRPGFLSALPLAGRFRQTGTTCAKWDSVKAIVSVIDSLAETVDRFVPGVTFALYSLAEALLLYALFRAFWR